MFEPYTHPNEREGICASRLPSPCLSALAENCNGTLPEELHGVVDKAGGVSIADDGLGDLAWKIDPPNALLFLGRHCTAKTFG